VRRFHREGVGIRLVRGLGLVGQRHVRRVRRARCDVSDLEVFHGFGMKIKTNKFSVFECLTRPF
jgi:hypothetical protein